MVVVFIISDWIFVPILVNRGKWVREMAMEHQRRKRRCQDSCWKVHDPAQSFILCSYTMHELRHEDVRLDVRLVSFSVSSEQLLCFVHKREQKHTTKNFVGFNHQSI